MLKTSKSQLGDAMAENYQLRRQLHEMGSEIDALTAQLEGDIPKATAWLQRKVWRQRRALDTLERKNTSLRFALRLMNSIRPAVTAAEWTQAREALTDAQYTGRVSETAPVVE